MTLAPSRLQSLASGLPASIQDVLRAALGAQDKYNQDVAQAIGGLGLPAWYTSVELLNGWVPFDSTHPIRFTKTGIGLVVMEGIIKSGTLNTTAFVLPAEYRPMYDHNMVVESNAAYGKLLVLASGVVRPVAASNVSFGLYCSWMVG